MGVNQANHAGKGSAGRWKREIRPYRQFPGQRSFYFLKKPCCFPADLMFQKSNFQWSRKWHQLAEPRSPRCRENIPRAQSLRWRAANQSHRRQLRHLGSRCRSKRSWSLLNWLVAEITLLLLNIKLLFRNLDICALSFGQLSLKIFGPTLFQWLLKSGNGAETIISHTRVRTHTYTHTYLKQTLYMSHYG